MLFPLNLIPTLVLRKGNQPRVTNHMVRIGAAILKRQECQK